IDQFGAVVVQLQAEVGVVRNGAGPAAEKISAAGFAFAAKRYGHVTAISVTLQGEGVGGGRIRIDPKAALAHDPGIGGGRVVGINFVAAVEILAVNAVVNIGGEHAAVANAAEVAEFIAAAGFGVKPLRVPRAFADDADDAVDGVGAPERAARTADDLDPVDVFEQ